MTQILGSTYLQFTRIGRIFIIAYCFNAGTVYSLERRKKEVLTALDILC